MFIVLMAQVCVRCQILATPVVPHTERRRPYPIRTTPCATGIWSITSPSMTPLPRSAGSRRQIKSPNGQNAEVTSEEYWAHPEGKLTVEWIDEKEPPAT